MERELKMQLAAGDADKIRQAPLLASALAEPPHTETLVSTYFDTPDFALHQRGASLRVRAKGEQRIQTLKQSGSVRAGLFTRGEYETAVSGEHPELDLLNARIPADCSAAKLLRGIDLEGKLAPVFVTKVARTVHLLRLPEGAEVELALDEGSVDAGNLNAPISELELELKSGEPDLLYQCALDLLKTVPLHVSYQSKGDQGYELLVQRHSEPVHAQPLALKKRDTVEQAFGHIAQNCLAQVHGNERGVVSGHDPASVHQMRVGLRRLRSALDLFKDQIPAPESLQNELKWIANALGGARDWEVLARSTLPAVFANAPEDTQAAAIIEASVQTATRNRQRAAEAIGSVRYTRLMLELTRWLDKQAWRDGAAPERAAALDEAVTTFANETLCARHGKLLKRGRKLAELDAERRHRARIAAKKLRYATEFFASLYPHKAISHYTGVLSKLQDDLGWRNDAVVADQLLRTLAGEDPGMSAGTGYARGYLNSRIDADHDGLKKLWKRFRRLSPPQ
jgi:triphosphatase